ncbi:MAG: hypothetical protein IPH58_17620 [Sphingobacteriales bacterium]|nr:hypothetical protein [Sphingobacteriales bacterium]
MTRKTGIYLLLAFILLSSFVWNSELVFRLGKNECKLMISGNDSASWFLFHSMRMKIPPLMPLNWPIPVFRIIH